MLEVNRPPRTELLETALEPGHTRRGDVLEILGPPDGVGRTKLIFHPEPRVLWQYFHEEGSSNDMRFALLWVFFDGDVYEGYLWFSNAGEHGRSP
jgi:hypothetical protein